MSSIEKLNEMITSLGTMMTGVKSALARVENKTDGLIRKYEFSQSALTIADNAGVTIGSALDSQNPDCTLDDTIMVSCSVDIKECLVYGYVQANGVIRVRVQNLTGASVTIDAATWKVSVI